MRMYDIIEKKRDGGELSESEIKWFVSGVSDGSLPDYQITALLMAIYLKGMSDAETAALTGAMAHSGNTLDLSRFANLSADKHSTGGVGDKTTLVVAPIAACLGAKIAKMSGRGLGHTGGTVDKLEAIPGYRTSLSPDEFINTAQKHGICVIGADKSLDPADKKLYALRDVTATVGCVPLIVSSIMSKKLAGGAHNIVLDVKCGSGSFMKTAADARLLAEKMVTIGKTCGKNVSAVITNMDVPLGSAVGNWVEVREAVEVLRGSRDFPDLRKVCLTLAAELVSMSRGIDEGSAERAVEDALDSGKAYEKFLEWISAQGGDISVFDDDSFCRAEYSMEVKSERDGYISSCNTEGIGLCAMTLGAGRAAKDDVIDPTAGILIKKKRGDFVKQGETEAVLLTSRRETLEEARRRYCESRTVTDAPPEPEPLIYEKIKGR